MKKVITSKIRNKTKILLTAMREVITPTKEITFNLSKSETTPTNFFVIFCFFDSRREAR